MKKQFAILAISAFAMLSLVQAGAQAANTSTVSSTSTTTASTTANTQASNMGNALTNNFQNPGDQDIHYSGTTGTNTAIGLGGFSSSFSTDYCGGTAQGGLSVPYVTIVGGKPILGEPGVACVNTRASVHTMEYSATYGNAAANALKFSQIAAQAGNRQAAEAYRHTAQGYAEMSSKLAVASVNMLCDLSDSIRKSYEDAGIKCPEDKATATSGSQSALATNGSDWDHTDPYIRRRMGLPPLK